MLRDGGETEENAESATPGLALDGVSGKEKLLPVLMPGDGEREEDATRVASASAIRRCVSGNEKLSRLILDGDDAQDKAESVSSPPLFFRRSKYFVYAGDTGEREESEELPEFLRRGLIQRDAVLAPRDSCKIVGMEVMAMTRTAHTWFARGTGERERSESGLGVPFFLEGPTVKIVHT